MMGAEPSSAFGGRFVRARRGGAIVRSCHQPARWLDLDRRRGQTVFTLGAMLGLIILSLPKRES